MTTPFDTSAAVLDAARVGTTVPGYEHIGDLLIDLARTTPVPPGAALGSSGVAAACAATTPGRLSALVGLVKPGAIVLGLAAAAAIVGLAFAPSEPAVVILPQGVDTGVSRVAPTLDDHDVPDPGSSGSNLDPVSVPPATDPPKDSADGGASPRASSTTAPPGGLPPTTAPSAVGAPATVPPPTPSAAGPPATVPPMTPPSVVGPPATVPPTTVPTTTAAPLGNNGNGNGNGVGNGKGNQGTGNPAGTPGGSDHGRGRPDDR
jgi:hypothetical protein